MQISRVAIVVAVVAAVASRPASSRAQGIDSTHHYSILFTTATGVGTTGGLKNNFGVGGSADVWTRRLFTLRTGLEYNRVVVYGSSAPVQIGTMMLDGIVHPAPASWLVRPFFFAGLGASRSMARTVTYYNTPDRGTFSTAVPGRVWYGPDAGVGLEVGRSFVQFRTGPVGLGTFGSGSGHDYGALSVGVHF